jgi:type VI secretion system secreted protein VgrG
VPPASEDQETTWIDTWDSQDLCVEQSPLPGNQDKEPVMPSPKDGSPGSLVSPTAPTAAEKADVADPGKAEALKQQQRQANTGKYGSTQVKAHKKESEENKAKKNWVEVELVDDTGAPVPGEAVEIKLPDGTVASGTTDDKGLLKISNIDPGSVEITFVNLDKDAWEPA